MRLLLVDDEVRVLEGLERLLYSHDDWDIVTAQSGCEAVEILEKQSFDVLVTDMRMPGMDGAELMAIARERHPEIVRVVLSGHAEDLASLRAARLAHQFLNKPCDARSFISVIERTLHLRRYLRNDMVRKALGRVESLPSVPRIYTALSIAVDADASTDEIAGIIQQDPALAAKLLQLVNSSFFVRGRAVSDVSTAVLRLGVRIIRDLVLTVEVFGRATSEVPPCISIETLQRRALRTANVANKISVPAEAGTAFVSALLRDVGLLALAEIAPTALCGRQQTGCARHAAVSAEERISADDNHDAVGAYILGVWGLPLEVIEAVANQGSPDRIGGTRVTVSAVVHIASALVDGRDPDAALLERTGSAGSLPAWRALVAKVTS
jgi:HD-like signal output (HDOD) protein/CheY-like chemotaxis protein